MARHQPGPLRRFERMSRLKNYTVEKGLADPRGWTVLDGAGQTIGQVSDLIVDTDRMAASYLEVQLDTKAFPTHDDPRVLVPMARADRDASGKRLVVPELTRSRIAALFEARAEHDARFWESWWRDLAAADGGHDRADLTDARPFGRTADPQEERRDTIASPGATVAAERMDDVHVERMIARESDDARVGYPADAPPPGQPDIMDERDPLEDPHYRRTDAPTHRRRAIE